MIYSLFLSANNSNKMCNPKPALQSHYIIKKLTLDEFEEKPIVLIEPNFKKDLLPRKHTYMHRGSARTCTAMVHAPAPRWCTSVHRRRA
jgi:hypothetical protein